MKPGFFCCVLSLSHGFHILAFMCMGYCNVKSGDLFLQIGGLSNCHQIQWVEQRVIFSHPYFRILPNLQISTFCFERRKESKHDWFGKRVITKGTNLKQILSWSRGSLDYFNRLRQVVNLVRMQSTPFGVSETPLIKQWYVSHQGKVSSCTHSWSPIS